MPSPLNVRARVRPWVDELLRRTRDRRATDGLSTFWSEDATPRSPFAPERIVPIAIGAIAALLVVGAFALVQKRFVGVNAAERTPGKLTVESRPAGAEVVIDGQRRGTTPATISVAPGSHTLVVRRGTDARAVALTIGAGAEIAEHFELAAADATFPVPGRISIATDPPGARVTVDGQDRGLSPVTVDNVSPATHTVHVADGEASAERVVALPPGGITSVVFSRLDVAAPLAGWLTVDAPFDVQIAESGDVVGTSGTRKIMLAAGFHDVVVTNERLGYEEARRMNITAGKTTALTITPPKAPLNVNARPWGDVVLDGTALGQTPLANVAVPIGTHELVIRHPELGERRQTIVVTARGPNRVTQDFTK
jgi:PEGA domain